MLFWVDVFVYVQLSAIFGLFLGLESDMVVTQFPQYDSQKGLDKPVKSKVQDCQIVYKPM